MGSDRIDEEIARQIHLIENVGPDDEMPPSLVTLRALAACRAALKDAYAIVEGEYGYTNSDPDCTPFPLLGKICAALALGPGADKEKR